MADAKNPKLGATMSQDFFNPDEVLQISKALVESPNQKDVERARRIIEQAGIDTTTALAELDEIIAVRISYRKAHAKARRLSRKNLRAAHILNLGMLAGQIDPEEVRRKCKLHGIHMGDALHPSLIAVRATITDAASWSCQLAGVLRYATEHGWSGDDLFNHLEQKNYTVSELVSLYRDSHPQERSKRKERVRRERQPAAEVVEHDQKMAQDDGIYWGDVVEAPDFTWSDGAYDDAYALQKGERVLLTAVKLSGRRIGIVAVARSVAAAKQDFITRKFRPRKSG